MADGTSDNYGGLRIRVTDANGKSQIISPENLGIKEATFRRMERAVSRRVQRGLRRIYKDWFKSIKGRHSGRWSAGQYKMGRLRKTLNKRSGKGLKSIEESMEFGKGRNFKEVYATISTGKMTIHETGGRITPKRAKFLAIPMPDALDRRGRPKKRGPRAWKNTQVIPAKGGPSDSGASYFIVQPIRSFGGKTQYRWLYALVKSATIPARLGMGKEWDSHIWPKVEDMIDAQIDWAIRKFNLPLGGSS